MITVMLNVYAEDPLPAIESAQMWIHGVSWFQCRGRYAGFPEQGHEDDRWVYESEHEKRNKMLDEMRRSANPFDWLLWLDCDERVIYASPQISLQLSQIEGDVAGVRFIEPLPPPGYEHLAAGLGEPGRSVHDVVHEGFGGRLIRHLPDLRFVGRHDHLVDEKSGRVLAGWKNEPVEPLEGEVDLQIVHRWWEQTPERRAAKQAFYSGPIRTAESQAIEP